MTGQSSCGRHDAALILDAVERRFDPITEFLIALVREPSHSSLRGNVLWWNPRAVARHSGSLAAMAFLRAPA